MKIWFLIICFIPTISIAGDLLSFQEFKRLPKNNRIQILKAYKEFIKVAINEGPILDKFTDYKQWRLIEDAIASGEYDCFYAGWPSKKSTTNSNGKTRIVCNSPKKTNPLYDSLSQACRTDQLLCNPVLFGPNLCVETKTQEQKNSAFSNCDKKFLENKKTMNELIQDLSNETIAPLADEVFSLVHQVCNENNFQSKKPMCVNLKKKVAEIQLNKKNDSPKILEKEIDRTSPLTNDPIVMLKGQNIKPGNVDRDKQVKNLDNIDISTITPVPNLTAKDAHGVDLTSGHESKKIDIRKPDVANKKSYNKLTEIDSSNEFTPYQASDVSGMDFTLDLGDSWALGHYRCTGDGDILPEIYRPKNYPDLLMLKMGGNLRAVLKLDPNRKKIKVDSSWLSSNLRGSEVNPFDIVWECKKSGAFTGHCMENTDRGLCNLEQECSSYLAETDKHFNRNEFFLALKPKLPIEILKNLQNDFRDPKIVSFPREICHQEGELKCLMEVKELTNLLDSVLESAQKIKASTPEKYVAELKTKIKIHEAESLKKVESLVSADLAKKDPTIRAVKYMFASFQTNIESILDNNILQDRAFLECNNENIQWSDFCLAQSKWKKRVKRFAEAEQVVNLTPKQCPLTKIKLGTFEECISLETLGVEAIKNIKDVKEIINE